jgi:8-oxo-dGTP pyrophosphatase MutT (NUDIX family)
MLELPQVSLGKPGGALPNWRDAEFDESDKDDDEELADTPADVIALLGFDPAKEPAEEAEATDSAQMPAAVNAAGILYEAGGRILFLKRAASSVNGGTWAFPAGTIEPGETAIQAAIRESVEETGHAPECGLEPLYERDGFALFVCHDAEFLPVLNREHDGYVWAAAPDFPTPLHPNVLEAIDAAVQADAARRLAAEESAMVSVMDLSDVDGAVAISIANAWAQDKSESARQLDTNGWIEVTGNPLSKAGVFPYSGAKIPGADPTRTYQVLRPEEELSHPDCLASFRLLPWINDHLMLGAENMDLTPAEKKGVHGVTGEGVYFDAPYLRANIKVFSQTMADLIKAGKRELSAGYKCKYELAPGVYDGQPYDYVQRCIRGNHLALVRSGRMGPDVAVLDEAAPDDQSPLTTDLKEPQMADEANPESGSAGMTLEEAMQAIKAFLPVMASIQSLAAAAAPPAAAEAAVADTDKGMADMMAKPATEMVEKKESAAMDAAEIRAAAGTVFKDMMASISRRDALARRLSDHVGTFDHSDKTEAEVVLYGCEKLGLKPPKGQEAGTLLGFLQAAGDPRKQPMARAAHAMDAANSGDNFVTRQLAATKAKG